MSDTAFDELQPSYAPSGAYEGWTKEQMDAELARHAAAMGKAPARNSVENAIAYIRSAPSFEKQEILGDAYALAMGARLDDPHPFASQMLKAGLGYDALQVNAGLKAVTSPDTIGTLQRGAQLLVEDIRSAYQPEHGPIVTGVDIPDYRAREIGSPVTFDAGELREGSENFDAVTVHQKLVRGSTVQLKDVGSHFLVTRQALVNADTHLISSMVREGVMAYYRAQRAAIVDAIEANSALGDGVPVFDSARANDLASPGGPLTLAALEDMVTALRKLPTDAGKPGNYRAGILCVPAEYELTARVLLSSVEMLDKVFLFADANFSSYYLLPPKADSVVVALAALDGELRPVVDVVTPGGMPFADDDPRKSADGLYLRIWGHHAGTMVKPTAVRMAV